MFINGLKAGPSFFTVSASSGFVRWTKAASQSGCVLIDESPILLFDEPLANLDPKSGQDIIELIDQIHKEEGTTTLIIEHRLEDVLHRPVDRIVLINDGRILFNGSPDQLLATDLLTQNGIREPLLSNHSPSNWVWI